MCVLPALTGCFRVTRAVQRSHPPAAVFSTSLDQILKETQDRYDQVKTLNASVEVIASTGGDKQGKVVEYTALSGYILLRKPGDLRVILFLPIAHLRAMDMVTNGVTFKLSVPPKNRFMTGTNAAEPHSKNSLENLRPNVFSDSLVIKPQQPGELVSLTSDERIYRPASNPKDLIAEPTYELSFHTLVPGGTELKTLRVVHIGRGTMLPFQQDIYDKAGQLDTQALYENYETFGGVQFPAKITIRRPKDQLSLVLKINKLAVNTPLEDDQFELNPPSNVKVEQLP